MRKLRNILLGSVLFSFLIGCGVANRIPQRPTNKSAVPPENPARFSEISVSKFEEIEVSLQQAYRDWKGTPYQWGGTSARGVDCSAFMQIIFNRYFGIELPRNTRRQLYVGKQVNRKNLKSGDLVFFKTGRKTLHVGVIIEEDKFLHASTSQGVTISSLDNYYWRSRFMTAKRIL